MIEILSTDRLFPDSPDAGEVDCICSRCGGEIPEETVPLRAFVEEGHGGEYRFCDYCQERMGIGVCEHFPVIVHRSGGPSAAEVNTCGECGQRIIKADGKWRLAPLKGATVA